MAIAHNSRRLVIVEAALWIGLAVTAWVLSGTFSESHSMFRWGAHAWPRAIAVFIILMALGHLVSQLYLTRGEGGASGDAKGGSASGQQGSRGRLALMFAVPLIYVYLLPRIGYISATPLFLFSMLYLYGARGWVKLLVVPVVFYSVATVVFTRILYVPLPLGYWEPFYSASDYLLSLMY